MLEKGQIFRLDLDEAQGDNTRVMLPHPEIIEASAIDHVLLVDDGKVKLTVVGKGDKYLDCRVDVPGKISNRKGVNTPDSVLDISPLTPKDRSDLEYMIGIGVDWIALSCKYITLFALIFAHMFNVYVSYAHHCPYK